MSGKCLKMCKDGENGCGCEGGNHKGCNGKVEPKTLAELNAMFASMGVPINIELFDLRGKTMEGDPSSPDQCPAGHYLREMLCSHGMGPVIPGDSPQGIAMEDLLSGALSGRSLSDRQRPSPDRPVGKEKIILRELALVDDAYLDALRTAQIKALQAVYFFRASLSAGDLNALYLGVVEELTKSMAAPDVSRLDFGPEQMELALKMVNERQKHLEYFFKCNSEEEEGRKVTVLGVRLKAKAVKAAELSLEL